MRTFYIFKINPEFSILLKDNPYNLFKTMEQIKSIPRIDFSVALQLFETVVSPINQKKYNGELFSDYQNNQHYTKYENLHMIHNYYSDEETTLFVGKAYLRLKSTEEVPSFLKHLTFDANLFACDFQNQDYFWLSEV